MKNIHLIIFVVLISVSNISNSFGQKKKRINLLAIPEVTRDKVICFALYTVHKKVLKITAQFYPLEKGESREARLEIKRDEKWINIGNTNIIERGWTAPFRIDNWDDTQQVPYRIKHGKEASY